jgi:hypothetical protein
MERKRLSLEKEKSIHRSIYRYTKVNSLSYRSVNAFIQTGCLKSEVQWLIVWVRSRECFIEVYINNQGKIIIV